MVSCDLVHPTLHVFLCKRSALHHVLRTSCLCGLCMHVKYLNSYCMFGGTVCVSVSVYAFLCACECVLVCLCACYMCVHVCVCVCVCVKEFVRRYVSA